METPWEQAYFSLDPNARIPVGFGEERVILALAEDDLALQTYAIGFWKPLAANKNGNESKTFYHIQDGPSLQSALFKKDLIGVQDLIGKVVQRNDFMTVCVCISYQLANFCAVSKLSTIYRRSYKT